MPLGGALAMGGIGLLGSGLAGYFNYKAAGEQQAASKEALAAQLAAAERQRAFATQQADRANSLIDSSTRRAGREVTDGYGAAIGSINAGADKAWRQLAESSGTARGLLRDNYNAANGTIQRGVADASNQMRQGYGAAQSALSPLMGLQQYGNVVGDYARNGGRLGALLSGDLSRENAYAGFEADPGYAFRKSQGQQAISNAAAAAGGRLSGRSLKALTDYNQNFASNEYGNFAQRRAALNALQMQGASAADQSQIGAAMNLANVGYGAQMQSSELERQLGSNLAGLTTAGAQTIAGNQAAYGQGAANLASALGTNIANLYSTQGQQLAGLQTGQGSALANLYATAGANKAGNLTGVSNQSAQLTTAMLPAYSAPVQYAGAGWNAIGNAVGQGISNAGFAAMYGMNAGGGGGGWAPTGQPGTYSRTQGYGGYSY